MKKLSYKWEKGENETQFYYDTTVNNDYICVLALKKCPNVWYGFVNSKVIHNKTKTDRERKKEGLPIGCPLHLVKTTHILTSDNPEYIMKKVEYCHKHNLNEISA